MPLYPPAAGAAASTDITWTRKTIDPTAWGIGNNTLLTVNGGAVELVHLSIRIVTALTSGGAATIALDLGNAATPIIAATGLAGAWGAVTYELGWTGALNQFSNPILVRLSNLAKSQGAAGIIMNSAALSLVRAVLAVAVITAGSIEVTAGYYPRTSGATIT